MNHPGVISKKVSYLDIEVIRLGSIVIKTDLKSSSSIDEIDVNKNKRTLNETDDINLTKKTLYHV